ncbi:MAG: hypothetical protein NUW23_12290 [Firmicutes bacterium]|nr:hypothetical protein [Bacillota bacterium]
MAWRVWVIIIGVVAVAVVPIKLRILKKMLNSPRETPEEREEAES